MKFQRIRIKMKYRSVSFSAFMCSLQLSGAETMWPIYRIHWGVAVSTSKMLESSSGSCHKTWRADVDANNCPTCRVELSFWVGGQLVHHFSLLLRENRALSQLGSGCIENLLKWIHIGTKWKWTPKCHTLWETGSPMRRMHGHLLWVGIIRPEE